MEQLDLAIAVNVQRIMSEAGLGLDDLIEATGMSIETLRGRLAAETSFTVVELAGVAMALGCAADVLIPVSTARREWDRGDVKAPSDEPKSSRSPIFSDANHYSLATEMSACGDRVATAEHALMCATENIPRLDGFGAWRAAVPGLAYLSGSEPHAVAVVVVHDPRDGRARSATLVATPDRDAVGAS